MTAAEVTFILDSRRSGEAALRELREQYRTRPDGSSTSKRQYYDTFDWRLYRDGGALSAVDRNGNWLLVWQGHEGRTRHGSEVDRIPEFATDVGPAAFRESLSQVAGVRRLLSIVRVVSRSEVVAVLDRRDKTVARVRFHRTSAVADEESSSSRGLPDRLVVSPLVGYAGDHAAVVRFLESRPGTRRHDGSELELALAAVGARPCSYSGKLDVSLQPAMSTDSAVRCVLRALLKTMLANEDGTKRDLDSEFLHDFRVAVRRTRSCLVQIDRVLPDEDSKRFRREFSWLGDVSGPTRDLDVYLLKMAGYRSMLPDTLEPHLNPLHEHLHECQRTEQQKLVEALESQRYRKLLRDWSHFLDRPDSGDAGRPADAGTAVIRVAADRIRRAFRRVRKRSRGLDKNSPAELLHRLRIDCKKLRYLLEFFRSLYEKQGVAQLVRALKRLQDDLGDFNDLEIQQRQLQSMASNLLEAGKAPAETLLAMGCLVGRLAERQEKLKRRLLRRVAAFVKQRNRSLLDELIR